MNSRIKVIVCLILCGCQGDPTPVDPPVVVDDSNVSGKITDSSTKKGIEGVPVTDGYTFVVTDADGNYKMKRNQFASKVYYTTPEGYQINLHPTTHVPVFYSEGDMDESSKYVFNFELTPLASEESHFTLLAVGDPQCAKTSHVNRFVNETLADMKTTIEGLSDQNVYAVTLGDIVYDSNDMWAPMKAAMGGISVNGRYLPFFQCIGNHDHDGTVEVTSGMDDDLVERLATHNFVDIFGPTDYSFDRKGVHFVVMDDIRVKEKGTTSNSNGTKWGEYNCRLQEHQLDWLDADLSLVKNKSSKSVVLCMHAPLTSFSNPDKILSLLSGFARKYVLVGHTHIAEYQVLGENPADLGTSVIEHILPTACGMWWKTNSDATGSPAGYNVYSFTDGKLDNWYAKGAHYDKNYQIAVYDGSQVYSSPGTTTTSLNWYTPGQMLTAEKELFVQSGMKDCLIADVFASDQYTWKVELFRNGVKVGDFIKAPDETMSNITYVAYCYNDNKNNVGIVGDFSHRCWYYKPDVLPSEMEPGWEVVATQTIPGSTAVNIYRCSNISTVFAD